MQLADVRGGHAGICIEGYGDNFLKERFSTLSRQRLDRRGHREEKSKKAA
jgi:hypothetical protein